MFHTDNYSRPNQLAGSVGKGWSLSTELQITRQVNGLDDLNPSTLTPGYYYASDIPTDYREGDAVQRSELNAKEIYYGRTRSPTASITACSTKAARSTSGIDRTEASRRCRYLTTA